MGLTTTRHRRTHGMPFSSPSPRVLGRAATQSLLCAVVITTLGLSAPARATGSQQTDARTRVALVNQTPFVGPVDTFSVTLRVTAAPEDATLSFRLYDDTSSAGRIHYLRTLRGDELGPTIHQPYRFPLTNLAHGEHDTVTAAFQIDTNRQPFIGFRLTEDGVYPLQVALQTVDGADLDSFVTPLIRLPSLARNDNPPLAVSVIAPIDAPVALKTDGSTDLDPTIVAGLRETVDVLAEHKDVPLTVAPIPETVVALQDHDEAAGTDVTAKLAGALGGRQVLTSPYVRLDLGAWVNDGMDDELLRQLNIGGETIATTLNARPDRRTWMVTDRTVTPQAMQKLRELGVDQVVVNEDLLTPLDRAFNVTLTRSFDLDTPVPHTRAVMADGILRAHIAASDNMVLNANRLLGDLAILYLDQPQLKRGAVLMLPTNAGAPKEFLATLLGALGTSIPLETGGKSIMSPATLDRLFAFVEPAGQSGGRGLTEGVTRPEPTLSRGWAYDQPGTLGSYRGQLALANVSLSSYRSILPESERYRLAPLEANLTVSGAKQFDGPQRQAYLDSAVHFVNSQAQQIGVPEQQRVTLTSDDGQVPLLLENRLSYPVVVRVTLTSDKVSFPGHDEFNVTLQPGSNRMDIPLHSRSSGAFPVVVTVSSPDGVLPMSSGRLPIRSTAISGFGMVLTICSGLFLAIWWARHFRSSRRQRRLVSTDSQSTAHGPTTGRTGDASATPLAKPPPTERPTFRKTVG